jgi:hypothetical protein
LKFLHIETALSAPSPDERLTNDPHNAKFNYGTCPRCQARARCPSTTSASASESAMPSVAVASIASNGRTGASASHRRRRWSDEPPFQIGDTERSFCTVTGKALRLRKIILNDCVRMVFMALILNRRNSLNYSSFSHPFPDRDDRAMAFGFFATGGAGNLSLRFP